MIGTTKELYQAFLDGIKKSNTAIVNPSTFNRIVNDWGQSEWLSDNAMVPELNQKQIDDLEKVKIVTDGLYSYTFPGAGSATVMYNISTDTGSSYFFTIPKHTPTTVINNRNNSGVIGTQLYPRYLRLAGVQFKISQTGLDDCEFTGISDWKDAHLLRSNQRNMIFRSPFRSPNNRKLYYEQIDNKIRLITNTTAVGYAMRLEYYRWPTEIFFNEAFPDVEGTGPGNWCNNCEFAPQVRKEIVDTTVRVYLERVKDARYQSYLNELMIKLQGK